MKNILDVKEKRLATGYEENLILTAPTKKIKVIKLRKRVNSLPKTVVTCKRKIISLKEDLTEVPKCMFECTEEIMEDTMIGLTVAKYIFLSNLEMSMFFFLEQ